jgi:trk system potassium uptake protein TrkH
MNNGSQKPRHKISGAQTILLGFVTLIFIGALLLMLPISSKDGNWTNFFDALFTSTSASCVTGLIVRDTQATWSIFGQIVILILIQIGGMGVVTLTIMLTSLTGKQIGLSTRSTMQEAVSAPNLGGIVKYTGFIVKGVVFFELAGALIMSPVFIKEYGFLPGLWRALFSSISAFCNAGFDLNGAHGDYSSMMPYYDNPLIVITLFFLILTGGLGFLTWRDVVEHKYHLRHYSTQSKMILICEVILIVIPAILLFVFEYGDMPMKERILSSLFQAITPRTAGFNTTDYNNFSDSGICMTIILMLIGGAPGSTAGGMKITTIAVLYLAMISVFRREKAPSCYKRRIPLETVESAVAVFSLDMILFIAGSCLISMIENIPMRSTLFECASAVATVGLSLGITPTLGIASKLILCVIMYTGRVGGLTLVFAAVARRNTAAGQYPEDHIAVG